MELFNTKLLTLMFNANDRNEDEELISFTKIVKGEKDDQQAFNFVRYEKAVGLEFCLFDLLSVLPGICL